MKFQKPDALSDQILIQTADSNAAVRDAAQWEIAKALETPLREGILYGNVLGDIYEVDNWAEGTNVEYPLDLLAPGEEDEFVAYTSPGVGYIAERRVAGDYVTIPTYYINSSVDWELRFARQANWNIVARALEVMQAGFVKKINNDGWHTLLSAVVDRNVLVYDADATAGFFTKRLVSLMKTTMLRNAGGNGTSLKKGRLTDLFVSPEALEDIRNWNIDQIDEVTRREIYMASDDGERLTRVFGVNLHPMNELGESQEYQLFFLNQLAGTLQASDVELVIGLDLANRDSFIMPVNAPVEVFNDPAMHRRQEEGYYGWTRAGFACLDGRRVLAGSF